MKNKFIYKNIFIYSSLQSIGNIEEYFSERTEKLVAFVIMPRKQYNASLIRLYLRGKLVEEKNIKLAKNIFLYYFLWYVHYLFFLLKYFTKKEKVFVITLHPISFFGMTLDRKSTRLNSSHQIISYPVFSFKKKNPLTLSYT